MTVKVSEFQSGEWPKAFQKTLTEHTDAKESLRLLTVEGMKTDVVLSFLYEYTHPDSVRRQRALRRWAGEMTKQITKTQRTMAETAKQLVSSVPSLLMAQSVWQSTQQTATAHGLRTTIADLEPLRQYFRSRSSQKGKGRCEETLVYLCLLIEARTGRPHWADLAYLLVAAFETNGQTEDWDEDKIRKIVTRYGEAYPEFFDNLKKFMVECHGGTQPVKPITRSTRNRRIRQTTPSLPATYKDTSGWKPDSE